MSKWILLLLISLSFSIDIIPIKCQDHFDETKVIFDVIKQLDDLDYIREIMTRPPPPPFSSIEQIESIYPWLDHSEADSILQRNKRVIAEFEKKRLLNQIDTTRLHIVIYDTLYSTWKYCHIDTSELKKNHNDWLRHFELFDEFKKGEKESMVLDFDKFPQDKRYIIEPMSNYPNYDTIFRVKFDHINAGLLEFSRVYVNREYGLLYYSYYYCKRDCCHGNLLLLKKEGSTWKIKDILLQWIS